MVGGTITAQLTKKTHNFLPEFIGEYLNALKYVNIVQILFCIIISRSKRG